MMKLYVLIRNDLSSSQQAVQAGHAVAEWLLRSPDSSNWKNGTLIYLSVEDEKDLKHMMSKLKSKGENCTLFKEPDIDNQITAVACLAQNPKLLRRFKLVNL